MTNKLKSRYNSVLIKNNQLKNMKFLRHGLLSLAGAIWMLSLVSCEKGASGLTNIRVHNASDYDFNNVEINTGHDPTVNFGDILSAATTTYKPFTVAYRYAYVRLFIDDKEFIIQPIDYVGETPLGAGNFTYVLDVVDFEKKNLSITAKED